MGIAAVERPSMRLNRPVPKAISLEKGGSMVPITPAPIPLKNWVQRMKNLSAVKSPPALRMRTRDDKTRKQIGSEKSPIEKITLRP